MQVRQNDTFKNIFGGYVIDEEHLSKLPEELLLKMRNKHYLPAIYAQLISLSQMERLIMLKEDRSDVDAD